MRHNKEKNGRGVKGEKKKEGGKKGSLLHCHYISHQVLYVNQAATIGKEKNERGSFLIPPPPSP